MYYIQFNTYTMTFENTCRTMHVCNANQYVQFIIMCKRYKYIQSKHIQSTYNKDI